MYQSKRSTSQSAIDTPPIKWKVIPNFGRTLSGVTMFPTTAPSQTPGGESPRLEYKMQLFEGGPVTVQAYLSPTLNFTRSDGLRYAVSFDDEQPQIVNIHNGHRDRSLAGRKWSAITSTSRARSTS